ncbi:hypothetical protein AB6K21_004986 [Salmonella enterica]|nr:hypothetical protein [Salmonella enterica]ELG9548850.1 hypothetical protein [Salmonella enterica]
MCAGIPLTGCTTAPEEPGRMEALRGVRWLVKQSLNVADIVGDVVHNGWKP